MPASEKVIKKLESLRDICNARSSIAVGEGKIAWAGYANAVNDALALLKEHPEIIRCEDCVYWLPMNRFHQDYHPGRGECKLNCWIRDFDWYCGDGKRKET